MYFIHFQVRLSTVALKIAENHLMPNFAHVVQKYWLDTLGLESLGTPKKFIQTRRTLFCFCSHLDNNQGGCQHFQTQVYICSYELTLGTIQIYFNFVRMCFKTNRYSEIAKLLTYPLKIALLVFEAIWVTIVWVWKRC